MDGLSLNPSILQQGEQVKYQDLEEAVFTDCRHNLHDLDIELPPNQRIMAACIRALDAVNTEESAHELIIDVMRIWPLAAYVANPPFDSLGPFAVYASWIVIARRLAVHRLAEQVTERLGKNWPRPRSMEGRHPLPYGQ